MVFKKIIPSLFFLIYTIATQAQTVDEVLSRYITFTGGEQQWKSVHTIVSSGTYNYGGIEFPFTAYSKEPNLYKFVVPFNGKYYAQAFNGKEGWKIDAFKNETKKTVLTGKPALAMANEADVELESPFINYQQKGCQATLDGTDTIGNTKCFKIKFVGSDGDTATYFFDSTNFALLKKRAVSKNAEVQNAMVNIFYNDYHEVNGIKIPYQSIIKTDDGQTILTITVNKVEINVPVADVEFQ